MLAVTFNTAKAQVYRDKKAKVEDRVNALLSQMTLDEKLEYIGGTKGFYIRAIERLGLPEIKMTDGPVGTHKDGKSTAYPASILSAATWDTTLVKKLGKELGRDSRSRGVHILLAPGVNIVRAPMGGRNFEYFSEDPFLNSRIAVNYITGLQEQRVVATVKHYAANNQEWDRNHVSSDIDERTLHEIYLPAFKAAVQEAKTGSVMNSYNPVNGIHATQHNYLNNDVLKGQWGFDGFVMSDWSSTYDGLEAAKGGLDIEMPRATRMNKKDLNEAINKGKLSTQVIDDKVRRILRIIFRFGFYDQQQLDKSIPADNPDAAKVALELARGGIVLLKNKGQLLPLSSSIKTLAVIGPNANAYISGGGSSYTFPFHSVSTVKGIQNVAKGVQVAYAPGLPVLSDLVRQSKFSTGTGPAQPGLKAEYFNNTKLSGSPAITAVDTIVSINNGWHVASEGRGIPFDHCSIRWTGFVKPDHTGKYKFTVRGFDGFRLWIGEDKVIDLWKDQGITTKSISLDLSGGKEYAVKLEYYAGPHPVDISFAWHADALDFSEAARAAAQADAAIVCVGFNESTEREGNDRAFELSDHQDSLINAIASINPNTIVVLNAGGNLSMEKWLNNVAGVLHAWYPGQEGGTAIAEILFGKTNPSGKLPVSFEKRWEDNPSFNCYYDPENTKRVKYSEGLFTGYRYYDSNKVAPLFPFGFGLSYSTFEYSDLKISPQQGKSTAFMVSFKIKNTGKYDGAEVPQLYVRDLECPVPRPYKELKGFSKVFLKRNEQKTVAIKLDKSTFSYYKTELKRFGYDPGAFEILIGSSSKDIHLKAGIQLK
ncbi:glycoside hydrolase family 3 C-terminal domain-containing protein [Pedobacter sp. MC2016-14]|uniref:beta-glucosidase n=1 Tax=Pedobacter sp. MC2016-14 TaxID=2897327 RepID=UPI001E5F444B|nr:glycoside hydrolase family 3 C-terminal domain-containing protein [Pedobacter sp. MC2016-14]MCD0486977.1 glycoside hydrolase family 3 C-terminal domain-containing protein [Pedobacter sp. MC2016-14]